ncbi:MAG: hypothetical protein AMS25_17680 [Gemmatimonas sp. SM23_52]|nr:MAG: hypothetical protein AMS25_17680 [Gemmatimonas sp. SM23_52]
MTVAGWLATGAVGLLAGAVSGLVGIGGGAIMVPFLYFFLAHPELSGAQLSPADQAVVAHATSLLVIVPISLRGAWLYNRARLVEWPAVWRMGLASVITAVLGARVAVVVPGELLKVVFGIFLLVVSARLLVGGRRAELHSAEERAPLPMGRALAGGAAVGFFSALLGVGGGLVAIPVLIYGLHISLRKVSATSLAVITFTALTGVIAYGISGWADHASGTALTYFHLPACLGLAVGALVAVPVGPFIQQRMPTHALRWLFAAVFLLLGLRIAAGNLLGLLGR